MGKPEYPTREGIWSRGKRSEPSFEAVRLGMPYGEAVANFRKAMEGREDFDPAVLFVWGTMQAKAVLGILKAVEEAFGESGQGVVRKAINQVGYDAAKQLVESSAFPDDLSDVELISFMVTGINTVLYASLERPWVVSKTRCEFDIIWCPHQDVYRPFDCRVQRYFVEGMIRAMEELKGMRANPYVDKLIPRGDDCCHFLVEKLECAEGEHPWAEYSDELEKKALARLDKNRGKDRDKR
ncbi:MAG: hypothetical protein FJ118_11190 [Deltaproteobacteria bacterium]|nr:hypothetical protein [Deltaproteobacteria bacterium]